MDRATGVGLVVLAAPGATEIGEAWEARGRDVARVVTVVLEEMVVAVGSLPLLRLCLLGRLELGYRLFDGFRDGFAHENVVTHPERFRLLAGPVASFAGSTVLAVCVDDLWNGRGRGGGGVEGGTTRQSVQPVGLSHMPEECCVVVVSESLPHTVSP